MLALSTDRFDDMPVTSFDDVRRHLSAMAGREDGFLILSRAEQNYVQLARIPNGFHIERRSGDAESHEIATSTILGERSGDALNQSDAERVLWAYFERQSDAESGVFWQKLDMQGVFPIYGIAAFVIVLGLIAAGAYFILR